MIPKEYPTSSTGLQPPDPAGIADALRVGVRPRRTDLARREAVEVDSSYIPPATASLVVGIRPYELREAAVPPPGRPPAVRSMRRGGRFLVHLGDVRALAGLAKGVKP